MIVADITKTNMMDEMYALLNDGLGGVGEISIKDALGVEIASLVFANIEKDYSTSSKKIILKDTTDNYTIEGVVLGDGTAVSFDVIANSITVFSGSITTHLGNGDIKFSRVVWLTDQLVTLENFTIIF